MEKIILFFKKIIAEIFSNRKIINMVVFIIVISLVRILLNGFIKPKVNDSQFLNAEEKILVDKFIHHEIKDDITKIKFYKFINSEKGDKTIKQLKNDIDKAKLRKDNPIDEQTEGYLHSIINHMENVKIEWNPKKLNGFIKPKVNDSQFLNAEEKILVDKFIHDEIKDDITKIKFYKFINTEKGNKVIEQLNENIDKAATKDRNPISENTERYWKQIVEDIKKAKANWSPKQLNKLKK